jgi:hypothetical protein
VSFSFHQNHVYGNYLVDKPKVKLCTVRRAVTEYDTIHGHLRGHKTWQEALLNKVKHHRFILLAFLLLLAKIMALTTTTMVTKKNSESKYSGSGNGIGAPVPCYMTFDVPYDKVREDKLVKDLAYLPGDAE